MTGVFKTEVLNAYIPIIEITKMEEQTTPSEEQQILLETLKGGSLRDVFYHYLAFKGDETEGGSKNLEWIELVFDEDLKVSFTAGEVENTVEVDEFDIKEEKKIVKSVFEGDAKIETQNAADSKPWKTAIDRKLTGFEITKKDDMNTAVILLFEAENEKDIYSIEIFTDFEQVSARKAKK